MGGGWEFVIRRLHMQRCQIIKMRRGSYRCVTLLTLVLFLTCGLPWLLGRRVSLESSSLWNRSRLTYSNGPVNVRLGRSAFFGHASLPNPYRRPTVVIFPINDTARYPTFHPTLLPLPNPFPYRYLIMASVLRDELRLHGAHMLAVYSLMWCFADSSGIDAAPQWPHTLTCSTQPVELSDMTTIPLPADPFPPVQHLIRGPRDCTLFWGPRGEPMLKYSQNSNRDQVARSVWLMDLRSRIPALAPVSDAPLVMMDSIEIVLDHPPASVPFAAQTALGIGIIHHQLGLVHGIRAARWLSLPSMSDMAKRILEAHGTHRRTDHTLFEVDLLKVASAPNWCFPSSFAWDPVHATNLLRLAPCLLDECMDHHVVPSGLLFLQIVHLRDPHDQYSHFGVLWSSSLQLHAWTTRMELPDTRNSESTRWISSIAFIPTPSAEAFYRPFPVDVGHFDSILTLTYSTDRNYGGRLAFIRVGDLLRDSTICSNTL